MSSAAILQAFSQLHPSQQIQLVEDLWDQIAQSPAVPDLSPAQTDELRQRKQAAGDSPQGRSWAEAKNSLPNTVTSWTPPTSSEAGWQGLSAEDLRELACGHGDFRSL